MWVKGSTAAVTMWRARNTTERRAMSRCSAGVRKRGHPGASTRARASSPSTVTALSRTRLTVPAPRVVYQSSWSFIADQDAGPTCRLPVGILGRRWEAGSCAGGGRRGAAGKGQLDAEGGASAGRVSDADAPAVGGDDRGGDAQPQPATPLVGAAPGVGAVEALEDALGLPRR